MAQPAERISTVPMVKIARMSSRGMPPEAIHKAIRGGHSSRTMPIGLSSRIRRKYRDSLFIEASGGFFQREHIYTRQFAGGHGGAHGIDGGAPREAFAPHNDNPARRHRRFEWDEGQHAVLGVHV